MCYCVICKLSNMIFFLNKIFSKAHEKAIPIQNKNHYVQ